MKISKNTPTLPPFPEGYLNNLSETDLDELKVLLYILSQSEDADTTDIARALEMEETDVASAVSFWRGAGFVTPAGKAKAGAKAVRARGGTSENAERDASGNAPEKLPGSLRDTDSRTYTGEELARLISENGAISSLLEYAQQRLGRTFSPSETASLVSLTDYILLTPPMVMLIIEYCVENGKSSMRYVEKTAISIYDEGIRDYESLVAYFDRKKTAKSNEGIVKKIIGIGDRNFTSKEKEHIAKWFSEYGSSPELITLAFEKTVANISKPSIPYMSKLLELWHSKGFKSPSDLDNPTSSSSRSHIDLDSFDEAAVPSHDADALNLEDFFEN